MGKILELKRWSKAEYKVDADHVITMELKRMKRPEARALLKAFVACMKELELLGTEDKPRDDISDAQKGEIMARVFDVIPEEQLRDWFQHCIRNIGDLAIDDNNITTGLELLDEADDPLLFWVLSQLLNRSRLSPAEVKASASPSMSPSPTTPAGLTDATNTEGEASPEPSIVEVTATVVPSSSAPA